MKTFEEYIGQASLNESRQKYIFGGTDNRNTNVMYSKKICELEQGDTIYWCNLDNNGRIKSIDNVDICKFVSLETLKSKNYKLNFSFLLNGKELFGNTVVDKRNLDSTVNEYYNSHMSYTIIGTNLDDLLDKLKDYVKVDNDVEAARKFFEEKEEELRKANESRQNYIFGGTDDRNTVIEEPKTFAELQDGDEIYWWYRQDKNLIRKLTFSEWLPADNNDARFKTQCGQPYTMNDLAMDSNIWHIYSFAASISLAELIKVVNSNSRLFHVSKDSVIDEEEYESRKKSKA